MRGLQPVSETNAILYFGDKIDLALTPLIGKVVEHLRLMSHPGIREVIPSYTSILIEYHPLRMTFGELEELVAQSVSLAEAEVSASAGRASRAKSAGSRLITLPVYYAPEVGPDLAAIAERSGLSIEQVIEHHYQQSYTVCAIGFAPGFAFLAAVDDSIATPRHAEPRKRVPPGSVGIANHQTAVYPAASPGGWQIIGNCPQPLFLPDQQPMTPFQVGDTVKFSPITRQAFLSQGGEIWPDWT